MVRHRRQSTDDSYNHRPLMNNVEYIDTVRHRRQSTDDSYNHTQIIN